MTETQEEHQMTEQIKTDKIGFGELHKSGITGLFLDDDIISQYTRADAIAEGVLVDLTKDFPVVKRVYKYPVACTASVWAIINSTTSEWVVAEVIAVVIARNTNKTKIIDETTHLFEVILEGAAPFDRHTFKIICHPGDNGEGVLTIMMPNED
jgi:hypothetical protein